MKNLLSIIIFLIAFSATAQTPYTEFTMPNTLNVKECTYGTDSLNSIFYMSDMSTGNIYMLWVQSAPDFDPDPNMPPNFSIFRAYYPIAKTWTFDPVKGWLVLNDNNNNTWIKQH